MELLYDGIRWQESFENGQTLEEDAIKKNCLGPSLWCQLDILYIHSLLAGVCKSYWKPSSDLDDLTEVPYRRPSFCFFLSYCKWIF